MSEFYKSQIPIYEPDNLRGPDKDALFPPNVSYGLVRRDYGEYPEQMFAQPDEMGIIPSSEWDARFDEQERLKSSLEHMYLSGLNGEPLFVNLDQGPDGYCWIYSVGHSVMLDRMRRGRKVVRLNPHSSGSIIKDGRDEGGWCGLGAEFVSEHGMAPEGTGPGEWPKWSRDLRRRYSSDAEVDGQQQNQRAMDGRDSAALGQEPHDESGRDKWLQQLAWPSRLQLVGTQCLRYSLGADRTWQLGSIDPELLAGTGVITVLQSFAGIERSATVG
jgi:hypothetical protein